MRHPTSHLKKLKKAISQARKITSSVPEHGSTTDLHHLKVQSYILLSHAAIEEYLEELGREVAREARKQFSTRGRITRSMVALVMTKVLDEISKKVDKSRDTISVDMISDMDDFSHDAVNLYEQQLRENHGIREPNQKRILLPIGVSPEKTDTATMNMMDAYGLIRGELAHKFTLIRTEHTLNSVETTLTEIIKGIANFDKAACDALRVGMSKKDLTA